jgi:hypothetical protein
LVRRSNAGGENAEAPVNVRKPTQVSRLEAVKKYFHDIDDGSFPEELFTHDFEFWMPKFGIGRGTDAFMELARGVQSRMVRSSHRYDTFKYIEGGDAIVVEGCTQGLGTDNVEWCGGRTPGGRFCSVFEFDEADRIRRMYIYLDPDITGTDKERFFWPERTQNEW